MADRGDMWTSRRILVGIVGIGAVVVLLFLAAQIFTGCLIDVGNEMDPQQSIGYVEPPRGAAPEEAVPFSGPDHIPSLGSPANPVSPTEESFSRGEEAYEVFCRLCHGDPGEEPGAVGSLLSPPPPDMMDRAPDLDEGRLFVVISDGIGRMPALASRMEPETRWDIVNYLRSVVGAAEPIDEVGPRLEAVRLYSVHCGKCHGPTAEGALGSPLHPSSFLAQASDEEIRELLAVGRESRGMPGFGNRLSSAELERLVGLLQELQTEGPSLLERSTAELRRTTTTTEDGATTTTTPESPTTTVPGDTTTTSAPGDQELGSRVFSANCVSCHGEEGSGGVGPRLQPNSFVQEASEADVEAVIRDGLSGTAMPAFEGRLSSEEIEALIALMQAWQEDTPSGATEEGAVTGEELPFSHRIHASNDVDCLFCHSWAVRGPSAGLPPLELCAGCHQGFGEEEGVYGMVSEILEEERTVSWPRQYRVPDWVFFSHQAHVQVADVGCADCHGDVADMEYARSVRRMTMGFCLDCHKQQEEAYLIDCDACHK